MMKFVSLWSLLIDVLYTLDSMVRRDGIEARDPISVPLP